MKTVLGVLIFFFLLQTSVAQVPTITSFSPTSGRVGTTITITGNNFSTTPSKNIVFFGAVQALVTNASTTSLTATVPSGTTYQPITVTCNGLTAYSPRPFDVTFPNMDTAFTANDFSSATLINTMSFPHDVKSIDVDGDGKPDLVVVNQSSNTILVFINTSNSDSISFATPDTFQTASNPYKIAIGDFDGDGKPDIAVTEQYADSISIFRNTSSIGNVSFVRTDFYVANFPTTMSVADLDGDGKPDLVVTTRPGTFTDTTIQEIFLRNTGSIGSVSFTENGGLVGLNTTLNTYIADVDNDGKPDIALCNNTKGIVSFFKNTSTAGNITFVKKIVDTLSSGNVNDGTNLDITLTDLDGDGKLDLAVLDNATPVNTAVFVQHNIGTVDSISFAPTTYYVIGNVSAAPDLSIGDLNGDGKPDIAVSGFYVLRNASTNGNISLILTGNNLLSLPFASSYPGISICDLDGDGKPELIYTALNANRLVILSNKVGDIANLCPSIGSTMLVSNLQGANYQWQLSTDGSDYNNISSGFNYTNINSDTLQLQNIPSSWYGYKYRCIVDGQNSDPCAIKFTDTWTGAIDSSWENPLNWSCGTIPDINTDVIMNSGTVVLSSNTAVRSLTVSPNASFTIATGNNLVVTH